MSEAVTPKGYAVMPLATWQNILSSVKMKTGKTGALLAGNVASEIDSISGGDSGETAVVPSYHYAEALRVANKIQSFRASHPNSLVFGAVSDIHIAHANATYDARSKAGIRHASFALETVGAMAECDFIANLGDNCWENGLKPENPNAMTGAKYSINALKPAFARIPRYNLVGNHDVLDDTQTLYDLIGSHNVFDNYGITQIRGFGYKDYTAKKVRVICLNTCDYLNASGGPALSYEQKDFLMRALDLSSKSDYAEWQILILSHIPLDWNGGNYNYYTDLQAILTAYEYGLTASITVNLSYALNERDAVSTYATYSNGKLVYNYSGKNLAKIIANIHGHVHTNKVSKVANTQITRVATANTNPDLNKSESYPDYGDYSITSAEAAKLVKVSGTVKDTSATFYCIDLASQIIYAYGYGADIDREIIYAGEGGKPIYSVAYNLTKCSSSNGTTLAVEGSTYTTTLTPTTDAEISTVVVTMGGVDITSTAYANGVISIANVTGDIVIKAVASLPLWSYTVPDIAISVRNNWDKGTNNPAIGGDNPTLAIGVSTPNTYVYTDRWNETLYLMPVDAKACDVTVVNADGNTYTHRYIGLKESSVGTLSNVFYATDQTENKYSWESGAIDYIAISMTRTDGSGVSFDFNDSFVSVTFTNGGTSSGEGGGEGGDDTPYFTNIIDTVGTEDKVRLRSSGTTTEANGFVSNYFAVKAGDIIRVSFPKGARASIPSNGMYCVLYAADKSTVVSTYDGSSSSIWLKNTTDTGYEIHIPADVDCSWARVAGAPEGAHTDWVVTVNEPIFPDW